MPKAERTGAVVPIAVPDDDRKLKKANELIGPRVSRGGSLSLLGRKVINVLLYHTQSSAGPGLNAPKGDELYKALYWLPLHELATDAAYNSGDAELIKDTLLNLQDIKLITEDDRGFASDVLLSSVRVIPGQRRAPTMVGWSFPPATEKMLRNPDYFTRLSLYYLTSLKTTAGASLYEICKRYATNPSRLTCRESWEWWHDVLTGLPVADTKAAHRPEYKSEYKYFKRDYLKPALSEVSKTDVDVVLIEHKSGRRVTELQFRVESKRQAPLELPMGPVIDTAVIERITALGVHAREAEDIFAKTDVAYLKRTLDFVEAQQRVGKVDTPSAFFRWALKGKMADAPEPKSSRLARPRLEKPVERPREQTPVETAASAARKEALERFDVLTDDEKAEQILAFMAERPAFASQARKSPNSRLVREALAAWLTAQAA